MDYIPVDGLTGFNVRVFNEVSFADASVQGDFLLCLYLVTSRQPMTD